MWSMFNKRAGNAAEYGVGELLEPTQEDILFVVTEMATEDVDAAFVFSVGGDADTNAEVTSFGDFEVSVAGSFSDELIIEPSTLIIATPAGEEAVLSPMEGHPSWSEATTAAAHITWTEESGDENTVNPARNIGRVIIVRVNDFGAHFSGDFDTAGRFGDREDGEAVLEVAGTAGPNDLCVGAAWVGKGGWVVELEEPLSTGVHAAGDVDVVVNEETNGHTERSVGVGGAERDSDGRGSDTTKFLLAAGGGSFDSGSDETNGFEFTDVDRDGRLAEASEGGDFAHGHGAVGERAKDSHTMGVSQGAADLVGLGFVVQGTWLRHRS